MFPGMSLRGIVSVVFPQREKMKAAGAKPEDLLPVEVGFPI